MQLNDNEIHIWSTSLALSIAQERVCALLLSPDEIQRSDRFRFPEHRRRFIVARAVLRQVLSFYTKIAPQQIIFSYNEHDKPAMVQSSDQHVQFNLSHSEDLAAIAVAKQSLGIDIEKIQPNYQPGLPERFFSSQESESLLQLPERERANAFYQIWARKEAIIKASGKGLAISLSSFSVSPNNINEKVRLGQEDWHLHALSLDPAFASALASERFVEKLQYYNFPDHLFAI